ncbi:MAG: response regulator, partial [Candidatus Zixiibacteriota bacterium]
MPEPIRKPVRSKRTTPQLDRLQPPDFTVLLVDDNPGFLQSTAEVLKSENIASVLTTSVDEAIYFLQANSDISLILTDLELPGRNGSELLKYLRSNLRFSDIPIIVVSSHSSKRWLSTVLALGAVDYLVKPVPAETLVSRVRQAVAQAVGSVLLVTGEPLASDVLSKTIRRAGFRLFSAGLGEDAVKMISSQPVNLLIADLLLADMTGVDLLATVKTDYGNIPVILIARKHMKIRPQDLT